MTIFKTFAALAVVVVLGCPTHGVAAQVQPATTPAGAATAATASAAPIGASSSTKNSTPVTLAAITVSATNTEPHIWTYRKGNSTILVLGTVYPEPKGLDFIPFSINHAISESGAIIGPPGFDFDAHISIFHIFSVWHAANGAKYLPDDKHLSDVLPATLLQQWKTLKSYYLPQNSKVEGMRPMYAGWKLYDAVLERSGVAVNTSIPKLIRREARKHDLKVIDAQFHWIIQDPVKAAHAFTPGPQADLACFQTILNGIQGLPNASRTLASAWASGDVSTMQSFLKNHTLTPPCWINLTNQAVAQQQGLDLDQRERAAWLAAVNTAASNHPVIFTTAPVQDIFSHTGRIGWLLGEGYTEVSNGPAPASASTAN